METSILLHALSPDTFYQQIRNIVHEELKKVLQQDQLLTREGALKMAGITSAALTRAINEGTVKPQLIKGRKKAMYLESEVLKIEAKRRS